MRAWLVPALALMLAAPVLAAPQRGRETHRIRIGNRKGAAIEVSLDGGHNWTTIGRVVKAATDTRPGFAALTQVAPGSVAAISLDAITVRTDRPLASGTTKPRIFTLMPAGSPAGEAAIGTDLPRGRDLFGPLAPPLGSEVLLETASGAARPLPGGYIPQAGDHLVIVAEAPADTPAMLLFENREGGRVLSVSPSGDETVVGKVRRPLRGVARYPATDGAPCGTVASQHPTAIVVATTPPAAAAPDTPDTRHPTLDTPTYGGFLIQPEAAAATLKPEDGSVLVVDRLTANGPAFRLLLRLSPADGSLVGETRVEARLDGGAWEPLPAVGGAAPQALTAEALTAQFAAQGTPRSLTEGITHLRLVLASSSPERLRAALDRATGDRQTRLAAAREARTPPRSAAHKSPAKAPAPGGVRKSTKTLRVVANIQGQGIAYVMFYVDGRIRKMTNHPPFVWLWDTRLDANGSHSLEIRGADADGRVITSNTRQVNVSN